MPSTGGYLVSPRLIAAIAASLMLSGVSKSGSPTDSEMMSRPWAVKSRAFCVTVMMAEGFTRESAWAMKAMDSQILSDARGNEGDTPPLRRRPGRPGLIGGQITSRSSSSHHRAAILFCGGPQFAARRLQLDIRSRQRARARKGKRHPSFEVAVTDRQVGSGRYVRNQ